MVSERVWIAIGNGEGGASERAWMAIGNVGMSVVSERAWIAIGSRGVGYLMSERGWPSAIKG